MTFAAVTLLGSGFATAADWARPDRIADPSGEVVAPPAGHAMNSGTSTGRSSTMPDYRAGDEGGEDVIGENEEPAQGMFGDSAPPACEFCGGGNCIPPTWSLETSVSVIGTSKGSSRTLGIT